MTVRKIVNHRNEVWMARVSREWATICRFTDAVPVSADVPLTRGSCPTEFGDF